MSLHVLQLGPVPPPEGGITRNIAAIRKLLSKLGWRSTVIATSRSQQIRVEPDVHHPVSVRKFLSILRSTECDILHLHIGGDISRRVLSLALACTLIGKGKKVLTVHSGGYAYSKEARAAKRSSLGGVIFRRFSRVIAVNEDLARVFRRFGCENVETILPFALECPRPDVVIPGDIHSFCVGHNPFLLSIGGMEKDYEPMLLIDAFEQVRRHHPGAGLVIVGGGSMSRQVAEHLQSSTAAASVLLAGDLDHGVVLRLIEEADLMLRITLFDGDAISVREALFLGTPVIATDNQMRPAGVRLVPIGDRDSLTAEIAAAIDHLPQLHRNPTSPDYRHIQKVIDLYEELVGEGV